MKASGFFTLLALIAAACSTTDADSELKVLTPKEQQLCDSLRFEKKLLDILKLQTDQTIQLIPKINAEGVTADSAGFGLCAKTKGDKDHLFILAYKERFRKDGFLLFAFTDDRNGEDYVGVIRGYNELEILKWRKTNSRKYGHTNADLIARFTEWKKKEDFYIVAAGKDYVIIEFYRPVVNVKFFTSEFSEFCPPALVEKGGDSTALAAEIEKLNGATLRWK